MNMNGRMEFNVQLSYILFVRNLSKGRYFFDFEPLIGDMSADAERVLGEIWSEATKSAIYDIPVDTVKSLFGDEEDYQNSCVYFEDWIETKRPASLLTEILVTFKADFATVKNSCFCVVYDQIPASWSRINQEPIDYVNDDAVTGNSSKIVSISELLIR
ncbi:hypothetical protein [Listeria rustica]|uniref:Uncharacterized protein n=1 Tax=Listeria rustica TaxID=2713503 RepID=A0A7W1YFG7_9LIST|nr:hypothetical protein [Listeria rustica]MBA3925622.1 hypothetical protein [Listeria rustica]